MYYRNIETDTAAKRAADEAHRKASAERMKAVSKQAHAKRKARKNSLA